MAAYTGIGIAAVIAGPPVSAVAACVVSASEGKE